MLVLEQDQKFEISTQMLARRTEMKQKQDLIQSALSARDPKKQKMSLPELYILRPQGPFEAGKGQVMMMMMLVLSGRADQCEIGHR